jgi:hypothetical protein
MTDVEKMLPNIKEALASNRIDIRWIQQTEVRFLNSFEGRAFGLFFYTGIGRHVCVMNRFCEEAQGETVREALENYVALLDKKKNEDDEPSESFGGPLVDATRETGAGQ